MYVRSIKNAIITVGLLLKLFSPLQTGGYDFSVFLLYEYFFRFDSIYGNY